ncbi:cupredoxin family copper-binding protein [Bradyrhizobium sp.]|uniref:cupredoxin domain-containing protein n=1 Tax=Bradyrhizobium sp. TaxID=376 RepID=UPI001ED5D96A|nr:cupredoxin family copper-binding protein [Bradyrhizobium sp.]MBV9979404.1 cupredoxin family copper-binding protein [Bradyrhizobium sp.]
MLVARTLPIMTAMALLAMTAPSPAATITIVMQNLVITPAEVSAKVGDTIEWVNKDVVAHTATAQQGGEFDVMLPANKSGSRVASTAGTFPYFCRFHPNMKATLTVVP